MKKKNLVLMIVVLTIILFSASGYAQTVTIGSQVWTSKNLDVSTYRNGDVIPQVQDTAAWSKLTTGAWCYYENDSANNKKYGKLYNWYAVNDPRGLAPKGYHIPTDEEWTILTDYLGDEEWTILTLFLDDETPVGEKMKSNSGWYNNGNGTNSSGFLGLPGGYRSMVGAFQGIDMDAVWCSSTEIDTRKAWGWNLFWHTGKVFRYDYIKINGHSVRCIRD